MIGATILQLILNELVSGKAQVVEDNVVGATRTTQRERIETERLQRLLPSLEERHSLIVLLEVNTTEAARTVIHIQVESKVIVTIELLTLCRVVEVDVSVTA